MNKPLLKIDYASHESARFACENWHYTKRIPVNKLVRIGAWEDNEFIGVVIFGVGASAVLHKQFDLNRFQVCELVRVAFKTHKTPVSRIISIALKFLLNKNPGLRVCVSFADPSEGHHGGIYQAGNWIYTGKSSDTIEYFFNGGWRHVTDVYKRLKPESVKKLPKRKKPGKYRYVISFDDEIKDRVFKMRKPYPKRSAPEAEASMRLGSTQEIGGLSPTPALQKDFKIPS